MTTIQNASLSAASITAQINGQSYPTSDASSGGISVYNVQGDFTPGQQVPLVLNIPFRTFSLDINLAAEVQAFDAASHSLGLVFLNLNSDHAAHLNRALKTYASGDVIATNSLSKTVSRDNFIKVAKLAEPVQPLPPQAKKQIVGMSLATLLGLAALAFIAWNIYQGVYTVNSVDATVSATTLQLRATANGLYSTPLTEEALSVKQGQEIGMIAGAAGPIVSPCDCSIFEQTVTSGAYVLAGEKLATLVPITSKPWIIAEIDAEKSLRIGAKTKVTVLIAGSEIDYPGKVISVVSTPPVAGVTQRVATVKIALDQDIPVEFVGKPAQAVFTLK